MAIEDGSDSGTFVPAPVFLMGLNEGYSQARSQILMKSKVINVNQVYALIVQDESQKLVAGSNYVTTETMELAALFTARNNMPKQKRSWGMEYDYCHGKGHTRDGYFKLMHCGYCNKKGHLKENCNKLIGYPAGFKSKARANVEQYNMLLNMLSKASTFETSANLAVDTGATNHMTGNESFLLDDGKVGSAGKMPTGEFAKVTKIGNSHLGGGDTLKDDLCTGKVKATGSREDDLYILRTHHKEARINREKAMTVEQMEEPEIWHKRLGHVPMAVIRKISSFRNKDAFPLHHCDVCQLSRQTRLPFSVSINRADEPFNLIHMDAWGHYKNSCPYTPQQNGVVERKHRHILETTRAIKFQSNLPIRFRGTCVEATTYIINRVPSTILKGRSPFEALYDSTPSLAHMRVIGCLCYAIILPKQDKFGPRAVKSVLLGYGVYQKGYKLFNMSNKTCFISRDVVFHESIFPFQDTHEKQNFQSPDITSLKKFCVVDELDIASRNILHNHNAADSTSKQIQGASANIDQENHDFHAPYKDVPDSVGDTGAAEEHQTTTLPERRSGRITKPPIWLKDYVRTDKQSGVHACLYPISDVISYDSLSSKYQSFITKFSEEIEPKNYAEAIKDDRWIEAMQNEIKAL
uniref:Integrase catalytic domain-containing protein n=1 Tax=Nicotiana tabacum TaxID=4097 RepID=A0A1S3XN95_TOBAC|nr:PREDICTED: uncharacterized protein LOC107767008 [Nicotiana tabacum]